MADTHGYIYSDLLCYVNYAASMIANRPLKSIVSDFYEQDVIAHSKGILINFLDTQGDHPKLKVSRRRRDSVSKPALDVDNILTMFTYADEHNITLPPFVTHSPNKMPSIRLVEGDLQILCSKIERLEEVLLKTQESVVQVLELGRNINSTQIQSAIDTKANTERCQELTRSAAALGPAIVALRIPVRTTRSLQAIDRLEKFQLGGLHR